MKSLVALILGLLSACAPTVRFGAATEKNSVPVSLWAEYCEADGADYRLERAHDVHSGRTDTRFWLNWHYDPSPSESLVEIPVSDWIRFRDALGRARCVEWKSEKVGEAKKFWRLYVQYPDAAIRAEAVITPDTKREFEPVRVALRELLAGKAF